MRSLPGKPGIYQYLDSNAQIIYVGKAKNLKKRVASYFTKTHQSGKLRLLVKKGSGLKRQGRFQGEAVNRGSGSAVL